LNANAPEIERFTEPSKVTIESDKNEIIRFKRFFGIATIQLLLFFANLTILVHNRRVTQKDSSLLCVAIIRLRRVLLTGYIP
jgi:hypothetical protein